MCTLILQKKSNKTTIGFNRDEIEARGLSSKISTKYIKNNRVYFISDNKINGSWLSISENGRYIFLLNGEFNKHKSIKPYKHSRGIIPIEYHKYKNIEYFHKKNFYNIEPFTCICNIENKILDFCWDGKTKHFNFIYNFNHLIKQSSPLYDDDIKLKRQKEIIKKIKTLGVNKTLLVKKNNIKNSMLYVGNISTIKTVSKTVISVYNNNINILFENFIKNTTENISFEIKKQ